MTHWLKGYIDYGWAGKPRPEWERERPMEETQATETTLPTPEDIASLIKLHPHLKTLLTSAEEIAGFIAERIIRQCPGCSCWCYEDDFRECVGYCPEDGNQYETQEECRWCREDAEGC